MAKISVSYVNSMGTDQDVANTARASFGKEALDYTEGANLRLVKYLAKHDHWTCFASLQLSIKAEMPLPIFAQMEKHKIGGVTNSISRRYTTKDIEFFHPEWRSAPVEGVKQGSGDALSEDLKNKCSDVYTDSILDSLESYEKLIKIGACIEQARYVLPQGVMTQFVTTGSLPYFARIYRQRTDPHAQKCWKPFTDDLYKICNRLWPVAWKSLIGETDES